MKLVLLFYLFLINFARLFLMPVFYLLSFITKHFKGRLAFERLNFSDPASKSFLSLGKRADYCFEISSEGELEQVRSLIDHFLSRGQLIELIYSSPSVEEKAQAYYANYKEQMRLLRLPVICYFPINIGFLQNIGTWVSARQLILCRYDFFPELIFLGMKMERFILLSATLKNKSVKGISGLWKKTFYGVFTSIVTVSKSDQLLFQELGIDNIPVEIFDFRSVRILERKANAYETLSALTYFEPFRSYLDQFERSRRVILGSLHLDDMKNLEGLEKGISEKEISVVIAPHHLDAYNVLQLTEYIKSVSELPIYHLDNKMDMREIEQVMTNINEKPGWLFILTPAILCELYCLFGHSFVGGGFGKSVHSLFEPYFAGTAHIWCGPKVHRSTEFDYILGDNPKRLHLLTERTNLYNLIMDEAQTYNNDDIDQEILKQKELIINRVFNYA